jgi:hypothetical protein
VTETPPETPPETLVRPPGPPGPGSWLLRGDGGYELTAAPTRLPDLAAPPPDPPADPPADPPEAAPAAPPPPSGRGRPPKE